MKSDETFSTGKYRFRFRAAPHLPYGWDTGVLFEETQRALFCSDLFHHDGDVEPATESHILGRVRQTLIHYQAGPLMDYQPFSSRTAGLLQELARLQPRTLATMHGSSFVGERRAGVARAGRGDARGARQQRAGVGIRPRPG